MTVITILGAGWKMGGLATQALVFAIAWGTDDEADLVEIIATQMFAPISKSRCRWWDDSEISANCWPNTARLSPQKTAF